jgi:hypothetical protein
VLTSSRRPACGLEDRCRPRTENKFPAGSGSPRSGRNATTATLPTAAAIGPHRPQAAGTDREPPERESTPLVNTGPAPANREANGSGPPEASERGRNCSVAPDDSDRSIRRVLMRHEFAGELDVLQDGRSQATATDLVHHERHDLTFGSGRRTGPIMIGSACVRSRTGASWTYWDYVGLAVRSAGLAGIKTTRACGRNSFTRVAAANCASAWLGSAGPEFMPPRQFTWRLKGLVTNLSRHYERN